MCAPGLCNHALGTTGIGGCCAGGLHCWRRAVAMLGSCWGHVGIIVDVVLGVKLGSRCGHVGIIVDVVFGFMLGSCW